MDSKIIIALHKQFNTPNSELYLPLHVGAQTSKENLNFQKDNEGENISDKNPYFCELTGLYWAWNNLNADAIGLVHYRRYLRGKEKFSLGGKTKHILSKPELDNLLLKADVVLPKKRNYFIETLYSHYAHTLYVEPLEVTGKIIAEHYPAYLKEFENLKRRRSAHMFNMFVMKRELLNKYCTWLFSILFELEKRIDVSKYDSFHARFFGRVSELLLDVYLLTNKIKFVEQPVENLDKVNFFKKAFSFIKAKFTNKKYEKSF